MQFHVALGDGITWSPACGVPGSTPSMQAQPLAWHEHLGQRRRGLLPGVGLLQALLAHGFPFAVGTGVCSPLSLNAFVLLTRRIAKPS